LLIPKSIDRCLMLTDRTCRNFYRKGKVMAFGCREQVNEKRLVRKQFKKCCIVYINFQNVGVSQLLVIINPRRGPRSCTPTRLYSENKCSDKIYTVADTYGLYIFFMKSCTCRESTMQNDPLSL